MLNCETIASRIGLSDKRKTYVGVKIIKAVPMDRASWLKQKDYVDEDGAGKLKGYLVEYPNPDGSVYESWSPQDVFDMAYREIEAFEKHFIDRGMLRKKETERRTKWAQR